jgi:hypothetical protein
MLKLSGFADVVVPAEASFGVAPAGCFAQE